VSKAPFAVPQVKGVPGDAAKEGCAIMDGFVKCICLVFVCLVALGIALPAAAQDAARVEVSGGYNFIRAFESGDGEDENLPGGWYADVAGNLTDMFAIVGQVNGNYKSEEELGLSADIDVHGFLGGVRLSSRANQRVVPFGQVLVGGTNVSFSAGSFDESETFFTVQLGGGVNLMASDRVGIRVAVDYLRVLGKDESDLNTEDTNVFRFAAGIVLPFGGR
jgi:opacity protein-like surface antigen